MATMTIAQALASTATGITIADAPANIAGALSNQALLARISLFTMNATGASSAADAKALAGLGSRFSTAGFRYTVRDNVAALETAGNSAGLAIATALAVFDTAANIIAAAAHGIMSRVSSVVLSSSASVTLAGLITMESLPSFSVYPGQAITLADTAANLLAITPTQVRGALKFYTVAANSTVAANKIASLTALAGFSIAPGVTVTVADTAAVMIGASARILPLAANSAWAFAVSDGLSSLLTQQPGLATLQASVARMTVTVNDSSSATVASLQALTGSLTHLAVANGQTLTMADTATNLLAASTAAAALASATRLTANASVTAAQLAGLAALHSFSVGGQQLLAADTLANLQGISTAARAKATGITVQDSIAHLVAARGLPSGTTSVLVTPDALTHTAADISALAALASGAVTLAVDTRSLSSLTVADTALHLIGAAAAIGTLRGHVSVDLSLTDSGVTLTAAQAAALVALAPGNLANAHDVVSDTGAAIQPVLDTLLDHGFTTITVNSGTLASPSDQLFSPALFFNQSQASARLSVSETVNAAQLITLSLLPGFTLGSSVTLTVDDTMAALAAASGRIATWATSVHVTDSETMSAAAASQLAVLRSRLGNGFSMGSNVLTISDTPAAIAAAPNAAGVALAGSVVLSGDAIATVAQAQSLVALATRFSLGEHALAIADTAAALAAMPNGSATAINAWVGQVMLLADATVTVANAQALARFTGFSSGSHRLTVSDTAANLLAATGIAMPATVILSQPASMTVADLATLAGIPGFANSGAAITVSDTPLHLATMPSNLAAMASGFVLADPNQDHQAELALNAAQFHTMMALSGLSAGGFQGGITITDTAAALTGLGTLPGTVSAQNLSGDATVTALTASALAHLPDFSVNGHALLVRDTVDELLSPAAADGFAVATSVGLSQPTTMLAATAATLAAIPHVSGAGVIIADTPAALAATATNIASGVDQVHFAAADSEGTGYTLDAAHLLTLSVLPNLSPIGLSQPIAVADTVANLVSLRNQIASAGAGSPLQELGGAIALSMTSNGTVSVSDLHQLTMLGGFSNGGHTLTVSDTPNALLAAHDTISQFADAAVLGPNTSAWTASAGDATTLSALPGFNAGPAGLHVLDSVAHIVESQFLAGILAATSSDLAANETITAAQAELLAQIANFSRNGHVLTLSDTPAAIAQLSPSIAAESSSVIWTGTATVSVQQYEALLSISNLGSSLPHLTVADTATNLLALSPSAYASAALLSLSTDTTTTSDQAEQLASLPNFHSGVGNLLISDTAENLVHATSGSTPDDWLGELTASSITLTGDAVVTAWQATLLATLGSRLHLDGHSLIVSDTPSNLLSGGNAAGLALAGWEILSGDVAVTAAQATQLAGLAGFHRGSVMITVNGSANDLLYSGNNAGLALADAVLLNSSADVTVAQAEALVALTGFSTGSANLQIIDSVAHLLTLVGQTNPTLTSLTIGLSDDATMTAAQLQTLMTLPESFTLNGHPLTIFDTGRHIATVNGASLPFAVSFVLAGDAFITAAQANALAVNGTDVGDNAVIVSDTASALLNAGNASGLALATMEILSANATLTAAEATSLVDNALFNTGGRHITVSDSVEAITGIGGVVAAEVSSYRLAADQDVTCSQLAAMTDLGSQFSLGGHALHVVDSASGLAALNSFETALVTASVLSADATVTAATAEVLAALPGFSLLGGAHLTIQDTVPHLLALSNAAQTAATLIRLDASAPVTVTVADADGLAALTHFDTLDATITVNGNIADLNGTAGWRSVATSYVVTDSVDNILTTAGGSLVADAASVLLSANGRIDAADLMTLAGLANFAHGAMSLTVFDGPAEVSAQVGTILSVATGVRINTSPSISAAQAEALVPLHDASMLAFTGSNHIAIEDSYAALTDSDNAGGLALATAIRVLDTAAHLLTATAHNWGSVAPDYVLSANATIAASAASTLAGLASHFVANGHSLIVADDASHVVAAAADIVSLGATVHITDTAADVATNAASLISLGSAVTAITFTDSSAVSATVAASLVGLQGAFTGTIDVADTASAVRGVVNALLALGSAVNTITVADTAAHVAASVTGAHPLQNLGDILIIVLTDSSAVSAASAAGLLPVLSNLAISTLVSVADTAVHVAASAASLQALGSVLGDISFTGAPTMTAVTAVGLLPVVTHLISPVAVVDTALNIVANAIDLGTVGAISTVEDTAAHVSLSLDALEIHATGGGTVHVITLTDSGTPMIDVSIQQITSDSDAIALIGTAFRLRVSDTAAHVQSDLIAGTSSILSSIGIIGAIVVNPGTITLTVAQILAANVDDGSGSALALMTGETLVVTGALVSEINALLGLGVPPAHIAISDTAANIQADITSGSSAILNGLNSLSTIAVSDHGTITLSAAFAQTAGVANSTHAAMALMTGGTFAVDNASVSDVVTLAGLTAAPSSIAVDDTAAYIEADLAGGGSSLLAHRGLLSALHINDGGVITLSEARVLTAHVDDGSGSVLSFMTGGTLAVTGVPVADITMIAHLPVAPASIAVSDIAPGIQSDLAGASALVANIGVLSGIVVSPSGTITLTSAQVQAAHVDDGAGSVFALMTGGTLHVSGVAVADIGTVLGLGVPPASMTVSDTAAAIQADLIAGPSALVDHAGSISAVAINDSAAITLTMAQVQATGVTAMLAITTGGALHVTVAAIADVATLLGLAHPPTQIAIDDSAANIEDALTGGILLAHRDLLTALHINDSGVITLTAAQALTAHVDDGAGSVLSFLSGGTLEVIDATTANLHAVAALPMAPASIAVSDTAGNIQSDLAGTSALVANFALLSGISVSPTGIITLTSAQVQAPGDLGGVLALMTGLTLHVTGVAVADVGNILGWGVSPSEITISDTAANIQSDLTGAGVLLSNAGKISAVTVNDAGTISLTVAEAGTAGVAGILALATGGRFHVTGALVADLDTLAALAAVRGEVEVSDTAANIQSDLITGSPPKLLTHRTMIGTLTNNDAGMITLTDAQAAVAHVGDGAGSVLSKLTGGSLVVTDVTVAHISNVLGLPVAPSSIAVVDTAANIGVDLAIHTVLVSNIGKISSITVSPGGEIHLTVSQILADGIDDGAGSVFSKMTGETLRVTGVAVDGIAALMLLSVPPDQLSISDTAAHIEADLPVLLANLAKIADISLTSGSTITLTVAQAETAGVVTGAGSLMSLLSGASYVVTGALVADIAALAALSPPPSQITVSDTAAAIEADLTGAAVLLAHRELLGTITNSDAGIITLTSAQALTGHVDDGTGSIFSKISGGSLTVTGVAIADLGTIASPPFAPTHIAVSDTAAALQGDLISGTSHFLANWSLITGIINNDAGTISLTKAQVLVAHVNDGAGSAFALMSGGSLTVTDLAVADIVPTLALLGVAPAHITISDTAADIQADLIAGTSHLLDNLTTISSITVSPAGAITLTSAQVQAPGVDDGAGSAFGLMTGATLVVTGVAINDITPVLGLTLMPSHITVLDTAANIDADMTDGTPVITDNLPTITSVKLSDASVDVVLATTVYNELLLVVPFDESALTITGAAADLLTAHGTVPAMLSAALHVTMDGNPTAMTAADATIIAGIIGSLASLQTLQVVDTAATLLDSNNAAGVALATTNALSAGLLSSASYVTTLAHVHAFDANGQTIDIQDTVTHLLDVAYADGIAIATHVEPDTDHTLSGADMGLLAALHNIRTNGHTLTIQDIAANIAALSQGTLGFASLSSVHDSSANVSANLNALQTEVTGHAHPLQIVLSDGVAHTPTITVTAVTYAADAAVLDAITIAGTVRVTGTAAQLAALAATLASDTVVQEVDVSDTATNILSNLTALNSIGSKFMQATISDVSVNASAVASLLTIPNLVATGLTITDTASQIAAAIASGGAGAVTFMNAHTVQLSADSVVTASEVLALEGLSSFSKNGHTLKVWDTAAHLTDSIDGYLAAVNNAIVDGVHLKTTAGTATVTGATGSVLAGITNFSKNNPNATSNILTIQDTAAHLESAYTTTSTHRASFDSIVVSANATVTDAVFGHLLTLAAVTGGGINITVRDTAANIAVNAAAQTSGSPSITPLAWALSGSATVTAANAAILGGLTGFSPGAFTLTLLADAASVSVADANKIGALGATFRLGTHVMHVLGDVTTVSGLTANAKAIATPDITDTFAQIATMTKAGNLLGGTITVTDSGVVSVTQASAFLDLLKIGGGAGIAAANVHFNSHVEAVTDTLSNIQTLTGSGGWTSNVGVHSDFNLVVADTVATLIDAGNLTDLEGMNGTTLAGDETLAAADAETLADLATLIHFNVGSHDLTIEDTPTNLLNPSNAEGEALATILQLDADATVVTSDAEALLTTLTFHLNHTLTVSDTSDNLLDGVLFDDINNSAYKASVHVELSGAETLDAQTAAHLVALPGFTNNGNLSIQDDSPYLLNAANHAAEVAAGSVTLNGDETVSASTAGRLAAVPHFDLAGSHLILASDDYADAATLIALADFDTGFDANGHSVTMTQNNLALTPTEYGALQADNIVLNGHALSALATGFDATSAGGTIHVTGNGVEGATANLYSATGALLSQSTVTASFDVSDAGNALVVTETVGALAAESESAPIIALERDAVEAIVTGDGAVFAGSGAVQVAVGEYVDLYTTASLPGHPSSPALVYDAGAHTLALAVDGYASVVLVTLGGATTPASLDPAEILIRHFT